VARLAIAGNTSKVDAARQIAGSIVGNVRTHVKDKLAKANSVAIHSATVVAKRTGLNANAVYALMGGQVVLLLALAFFLCVVRPRWRRIERLREQELAEAVEILEIQRAHQPTALRAQVAFPKRIGRSGGARYDKVRPQL
tara:strand:- start:573 stop:992 length:420 start_codon:yes stop_codon:yes gene_type:complete